jgi:hypothetical protein
MFATVFYVHANYPSRVRAATPASHGSKTGSAGPKVNDRTLSRPDQVLGSSRASKWEEWSRDINEVEGVLDIVIPLSS